MNFECERDTFHTKLSRLAAATGHAIGSEDRAESEGAVRLDGGIIRFDGNPFAGFAADPLLILELCTFESQLGYAMEPQTQHAMVASKLRLLRVPSDEIVGELQKFLLGEHVHDALLDCVDVIGAVLPEIVAMKGFEQHSPYHIYDVLEHTAWVLQRCASTPIVRWAALFHDVGKPGAFFMDGDVGHFFGHPRLSAVIARGALARLGFEPDVMDKVLALVIMHDERIACDEASIGKAIERLGGDVELFRMLCDLKRADALAHSEAGVRRAEEALELERALDDMMGSAGGAESR